MTIVYWIYNGLQNLGLISKAKLIIIGCFLYSQAIAQNCTPLILDAVKFGKCMMNPPDYNPPNTNTQKQIDVLTYDIFHDKEHYYDLLNQDPYMQMLKKNELDKSNETKDSKQ